MAIDADIENLKGIALFSVFEPEALRALVFRAEMRLLRVGDALFRKGETSDGGYILTAGSIALETRDDGRPSGMIVRPWALLGEIALITPTTRPVTAVAREPATVLKLSRGPFQTLLEQHPQTAARVRHLFKNRLEEFASELKFETKV